jgi:hypothetical protein
MDPRIIDLKTNDASPVKPADGRFPLIAGPMIWYALAGLAILLSGYLFLFASPGNETRHGVGLFVGLWAPMFGILGLRAEMIELREDLSRRRRG